MTDVEILMECRMAIMKERALSRQIERLSLMSGPREIGSQAFIPAGDRKTNNATAKQMQQLDGLIEKLILQRNDALRKKVSYEIFSRR